MINDNERSVGDLDEEIMKLEEQLEKSPSKEVFDRMMELMKISNKKSLKKNKWNVTK